jgi:hypothetical protein
MSEPPSLPTPLPQPGLLARLHSAFDWIFGLISLCAALAALSVIPILNLLSLGYLLHASAQVSHGRIRDGFVGVRKASRAGSIVLGITIVLLPVQVLSRVWKAAVLIDPSSQRAQGLHLALVLLTTFILWHIAWACIRGGRLRHFAWPAPIAFLRWLMSGGKYSRACDAVWDYVTGLRLPYFFWLGCRGFAGAVCWLLPPVLIMMLAARAPAGPPSALISFVGALGLMAVVIHLPFLQTHFARENEFAAIFEIGAVREQFRKAPIAFLMALLVVLVFALPLYLLKIELTPQEVAWLPALVFVAFIFPARLLTGWAFSRARRREGQSGCLLCSLVRLAEIPIVAVYALAVYATQFLSWHGTFSLLEQHAFLVPAPLLGL